MITRLPLLLAAVVLIMTGCEPTERDRQEPSSPTTASPVSGGHLVVGIYGEPATFDPYSPLASDLTRALARPVYRSLYTFDEEGAAVPDLARTMRTSGDIATISIGRARWSDGSAISARHAAASLERAADAGLIDLDSARSVGRKKLILSGDVEGWEEALAAASFVLPPDPRDHSGPFVVQSRTPGLQMVLAPNEQSDTRPVLDKLTIRFTEGVDMLLALLDEGELDAAWLPSTVNLAQRLDELGLSHVEELGWETVTLDLSGSELERSQRRSLARAIDRAEIEQGFIRDDGRIADTLAVSPDGSASGAFESIFRGTADVDDVSLRMAAPGGDELLELIQRLAQVQLTSAGFDVELINVDARRFYGEWGEDPPVDVAVRRRLVSPGSRSVSPRQLIELPLFQVDSFVAWTGPAGGLDTGGPDGPFALAHEWHVLP